MISLTYGNVRKGGGGMFNKAKFRAKVIENGLSMKDVAQSINVDTATLYRKMNGTSDFYRNEINELCLLLNIESPVDIFFGNHLT